MFTLRNVLDALVPSSHVRRAVLFVSNGFSTNVALDDELVQMFETARRADIPVYTVDPRGLVLPEDARVRGRVGAIRRGPVESRPPFRAAVAFPARNTLHRHRCEHRRTGVRKNQSDLMGAIERDRIRQQQLLPLGLLPGAVVRARRTASTTSS